MALQTTSYRFGIGASDADYQRAWGAILGGYTSNSGSNFSSNPNPIMGLIPAVTDRETRTSKTAFQLFRKKRKALQFLDKYGIIVSIICRVL